MDDYRQRRSPAYQIGLAELGLSADPRDVVALTSKGMAYDNQVTDMYRKRYPDRGHIPSKAQQADYDALMHNYFEVGAQLTALGWRRRTPEQDAAYTQSIEQAKASQKGG